MTDEQIKQNADKYADKLYEDGRCTESTAPTIQEIYIAGAHSRDEEVEHIEEKYVFCRKKMIKFNNELNKLRNPWISVENINTHESYVSLETAKLLKQAGFDLEVNHYYFMQNGKTEAKSDFRHPAQNYNENMTTMDSKSFEFEVCSRPTFDVAQRWLREVKGIHICVKPDEASINCKYFVTVIVIDTKWGPRKTTMFDTYEEAQEAGIKKALEIILEKGE